MSGYFNVLLAGRLNRCWAPAEIRQAFFVLFRCLSPVMRMTAIEKSNKTRLRIKIQSV